MVLGFLTRTGSEGRGASEEQPPAARTMPATARTMVVQSGERVGRKNVRQSAVPRFRVVNTENTPGFIEIQSSGSVFQSRTGQGR